MLDGVELEQVQKVEAEDEEVLGQHGVPALEGDFLEDLGRRATRLTLTGVITGADSGDELKTLREKFRSATPVPFVEDIAVATKVDKVLIEEFGVRELAGRPNRFEFEMTLREFLPPPRPEQEEPPPPPPPPPRPVPEVETGTLEVEVIVEGQTGFDFSKVTVTAVKLNEDGTRPSQTLTTRAANIWTEERMAVGEYTINAVVTDPPPMTGSTSATLRAGQITRVQIILRPGPIIATQFVAHFRFDNAFLEPCMREVVQQITRHATTNSDQKLLMVGNTDEVGSPRDLTASDPYNQSLSERRARSAFAYARSSVESATSNTEWNALRQGQAGLPTVGDKWGPRQYQYMLQALGFYPGVIDGDHGPLTSDAVRSFREAKGLAPGTTVDDPVWQALIADYLAQDNAASPAQFLPNTNPPVGCDGGILKWLGVATQDPVTNIRAAHRPNRRVEFLFVNSDRLPCEEPQPDTFNLPSPGAVSPTWCLLPGNPRNRTCFVVKHLAPAGTQPQPNQWVRQPAEPGTVTVRGRIVFEDGSPAPNVRFILIAPDGEFMDGERSNGDGNVHRTAADGTFSYATPKGVGIYTMEIQDPLIARLEGQNQSAAHGAVVCKRMDGSSDFNVVVRNVNTLMNPVINLASPIVVVRKPHTNPARQIVTLTTDGSFFRSGTVTRVGTAIHFFDAAVNGTEILFDGTDNVFTGARLTAGVQLFAESTTPSAVLDDVQLTLTLTPGATPVGPPATATMTAVELTLDICQSRTTAGVDPTALSAADKINPGRSVQVANSLNSHERVMLIVRPSQPAAFTGDLVLNRIDNRVQLFAEADETPTAGQVVLVTPLTVPSTGAKFWVEGVNASTLVRDTGFRLGILNGEQDADHVAITVVQLEVTAIAAANSAAVTFVRFGLWDDAFDPATGNLRNLVAENRNFVGSDSRSFFFRIRDPNRAGTANVRWRTVFANNTNDDTNDNLVAEPGDLTPTPVLPPTPPTREDLTVTETGAASGIFLSKALFLITDKVDAVQGTDSGLTVGDVGVRGRGQSNHRLRRMKVDNTHQFDGRVVLEYAPIDAGVRPFTLPTIIFNRTPDERRRVRIHFINVRDRVGGTPVLTNARQAQLVRAFQEMYALCGVFAEIDSTVIDPRPTTIGWPAAFPGDPLAVDPAVEGFQLPGANLVASASQTDLINFVRTSGVVVFNPNDLYIIYVGRILDSPLTAPLTSGTLGQAFPDSFTAAGSPARGFVFVGVRGATINTDLHEVTHSTTNLRNQAGGHFYYGVVGPPPNRFTIGNVDAKNLMFPIALSGLGIADPKRLWDIANPDNPMVNPNFPAGNQALPSQTSAISGSRFTRNF